MSKSHTSKLRLAPALVDVPTAEELLGRNMATVEQTKRGPVYTISKKGYALIREAEAENAERLRGFDKRTAKAIRKAADAYSTYLKLRAKANTLVVARTELSKKEQNR